MVTKVKITPSPPWYLFNKHLETIYPALFRKTNNRRNTTIRIITNDNDFIDLDIYDSKANKTVILSHGLEGNSQKSYMTGMIDVLVNAGFNCVAWNYRGCSGTINKYPYSYHSGATQDLDYILKATIDKFPLTDIFLIGFSLGGNLTLKYLGENSLNPKVSKAVAISTPIDLYNSVLEI